MVSVIKLLAFLFGGTSVIMFILYKTGFLEDKGKMMDLKDVYDFGNDVAVDIVSDKPEFKLQGIKGQVDDVPKVIDTVPVPDTEHFAFGFDKMLFTVPFTLSSLSERGWIPEYDGNIEHGKELSAIRWHHNVYPDVMLVTDAFNKSESDASVQGCVGTFLLMDAESSISNNSRFPDVDVLGGIGFGHDMQSVLKKAGEPSWSYDGDVYKVFDYVTGDGKCNMRIMSEHGSDRVSRIQLTGVL